MTERLLHVADPRFSGAQGVEACWHRLGAALKAERVTAIVCAGSLVDTNTKAAWDQAVSVLGALRVALGLDKKDVFLVPGPRDLDASNTSRDQTLPRIVADGRAVDEVLGDSEQAAILRRNKAWKKSADKLSSHGAPPWSVQRGGVTICGFDSAWASPHGVALAGAEVATALAGDATVRVGVMFHAAERVSAHRPRLEAALAVLLTGDGAETAPDAWPSRPWTPRVGPAHGAHARVGLLHVDGTDLLYGAWTWVEARQCWTPERTLLNGPVCPPTASTPTPLRRAPVARRPSLDDVREPYPVLGHYEHAELLGGRHDDVAALLAALSERRLLVCVHAPSGAGKSSLLEAGLLPSLRGWTGRPARPVSWTRHPTQDVVRALGGGLCDPPPADPAALADLIKERYREAGVPIVLGIDQLEEGFAPGQTAGLARIAQCLVATYAVDPTTGDYPCRWVLSYRQDFHGAVEAWLRDPLRVVGPDLPRVDLMRPDVRASFPLRLLGDHADPTEVFLDAILKPLRLVRGGAPRFRYRLAEPDARRLAACFADARRVPGRSADALAPELQVVLRRLLDDAQPGGLVVVPDDLDGWIEDALATHLSVAIDRAAGHDAAVRTRLLLALGHDGMVTPDGRRGVGLAEPVFRSLVGDAYDALQAADNRLIRREIRDLQPFLVLPHDALASTIRAWLCDPAALFRFGLDRELVELARLVDGRAALWERDPADPGAVVVDAAVRGRLLARRAELCARHEGWWQVAEGAWRSLAAAERQAAQDAEIQRVRSMPARKGAPLRALHELRTRFGLGGPELAGAFGGADGLDPERRDELFAVGAGTLPEAEWGVLADLVEEIAPATRDVPQAESLWGALLAALEPVRRTDPGRADRAEAAVVRAMRDFKGEPAPIPEASWSPVIAGTFWIGSLANDPMRTKDEVLHEVTLEPYRVRRFAERHDELRVFLAGGHGAWRPDWPAAEVSWYEALAYAVWRGVTLPTEAQWEVASRGGNAAYHMGAWWFGDDEDRAEAALRTVERSRSGGPVAVDARVELPMHPLGLHHVHGNVHEWCSDWYDVYDVAARASPRGPVGAPPSAWRVFRGGSWNDAVRNSRAASRLRVASTFRNDGVGLRLAFPQPISVVDR